MNTATARNTSATPQVLTHLLVTLTAQLTVKLTAKLTAELTAELTSKLMALLPARAALRGLARGATVWVDRPRGRLVRCVAGTLWLTFDGEPQDVILEAGDSHRCTCASRLGIHAMQAGRMAVE